MSEVEALIAPVLAAIPREEAFDLLTDAGIACGRLSSLDDLIHHPQSRRVTAGSPTGPVELMARGVRFSDMAERQMDVPALGAHSADLRAEFPAPSRRQR